MKPTAFILAGLLLAGCSGLGGETLPDGVSAADVALFKSVVAEQGCDMQSGRQAEAVQAGTGFETEKLRLITQYLTFTGESEPTYAGFRLTSGPCANA